MNKLIILVVLILVSCANVSEATIQATEKPNQTDIVEIQHTSTPTSTSTVTATATTTNTPEPTSTPEPTNTPTQIPEELKEQIAQNYTAMVLIQTDANMLMEGAKRINSGELDGFEKVGFIIGLATLYGAIDEAIPEMTIVSGLDDYWSESIKVHEETKELLAKWMDLEIDSGIVMEELEYHLERIEEIISTLEELLGLTYQFEESELSSIREEILESMDEIFEYPNP